MKQSPLHRLNHRVIMLLFIFTSSTMMLWAQEMSEKLAWTTQMFLKEQVEKVKQPTKRSRRVQGLDLQIEKMAKLKTQRLIASPDTIGGMAYISCFIHLKDVSDLSQLQSLGVVVEESFDGLDFVTARVPVSQLESLAEIDNVTRIKVAQMMSPMTDVARQKTNVDDLLTTSNDAISAGLTDKYDGTGVVLGIIDTGIDFQHVAFKDKNGNSRIKRAYVYDGKSAQEYPTITNSSPTTDDNTQDHGTHTATTAGGSSVIVNGSAVTVTDDHSSATYGGMAPGVDFYLAGVSGLYDTYLMAALKKIVQYADAQDKPLVVSNSWGSQIGPHDGTGAWADFVGQYFGDSHPNHVILFSSSNDAQSRSKDNEGGGFFVKKNSANSSSPLGTILRCNILDATDAGSFYHGYISFAWCTQQMKCKIHVLNNETGALLKTWTVSSSTSSFSGLDDYYDGTLHVIQDQEDGKSRLIVKANQLVANNVMITTQNGTDYYKSKYTLAIEVYPVSGSADVNMWAGNSNSYAYFTNHLTTSGHKWLAGTADMCVSDQATIPDAISVGAYMSKTMWMNHKNDSYGYIDGFFNPEDDIAIFSSYATHDQSPTGLAYPWITAPGAMVVAGVNHYHTTSVDEDSYFSSDMSPFLVVNNKHNPYGAMQGTSMATPVAAGIVALWLQAANSVGINLTVNDVKDIMEKTAINDSYSTTGENASHFGKGKIDALAGIQYILDLSGRELTLSATPKSSTVSYSQEIMLNASESGANIYYTIDGTEPTPSSSLYKSPLKIDHNLTLKAKAFLDGYEPSTTLTETYQVKLDITADKESGYIEAGQMVTLSCKHPQATIYYTTDGSIPTKQSLVYKSSIKIDKTVTIKAIAMFDACLSSDVLTCNFDVPKLSLEPSLASGIVDYLSEVELSTDASDATIYYTTDGSTPTEGSQVYTKPIVIYQNVTIKAKAFHDGYEPSEILTETYQAKLDITADKESGYIESGQLVTLNCKNPQATIYYTTDGSMPTKDSQVYKSPITIDRTVTIKAIAMHDECLSSNILTRNYVVRMDQLILEPSLVSGNVDYLSEIELSTNAAGATIYYTTDESTPTEESQVYTKPIVIYQATTIKAKAFLDGYEPSEILTETYKVKLDITADKESSNVEVGQRVILSCKHPDAIIYYTTDGSTPTKGSQVYTKPIDIYQNVTIKAKAILDGYEDSETLSETYQVKLDITADPESGNVEAGQLVTLSCKHPEATIYYTTDGSMPTEQGLVYNTPIKIDRTITIKAIATHDACLSSDILTRDYVVSPIEITNISISPSELELIWGQKVRLSYSYAPAGAVISSLKWESSAPDIASIDQHGLVTGLRPGHATLTVTTQNGVKGKCELTVIEPRLRFYVWLRNGNVHVYDIVEHPNVTLGEKKFTLTTASKTVEYDAIDILYFTLQDEIMEDGISVPKAMEDVQFCEGALLLTSCSPHMPVYIYDTAGKMVQTAKTDKDGSLSLSLASLRAGIYIIKTKTTTFKIQKR